MRSEQMEGGGRRLEEARTEVAEPMAAERVARGGGGPGRRGI